MKNIECRIKNAESLCVFHSSFLYDLFRDQPCHIASREPSIDVHDRHICGAAVEHPQERCDATQSGTVADASRNGDYGTSDMPADDARKCSFHSSDDNDGIAVANL